MKGAWGAKPFENDSALDWLAELTDVARLRRMLTIVTETTGYLDVDEGSAAIAAAEIVASARGIAPGRLSQEAKAWVDAHATEIADADRALARRAIDRALAEDSELAELWDENGSENDWRNDTAALVPWLA